MDEILQAMNDENDRLLADSRKDTWSDSVSIPSHGPHFCYYLLYLDIFTIHVYSNPNGNKIMFRLIITRLRLDMSHMTVCQS